ncbi:Pseudouridine synthase [Rubripirellula tenax]|uniref:Pseudouridine synthase n=1 Tax=Rubripirellula tenax TaxID=2528015 RepID=A0A5C6FFD5_9BACT|nr:Pseudouridine synthase [Rubripirellula tenax]
MPSNRRGDDRPRNQTRTDDESEDNSNDDVEEVDGEAVVAETVYRDFVVPESADGDRVDLFLTQSCDGYSRTQIRAAVQDDGAEVDGRVCRPSLKLKEGQRVRFRVPPLPTDDTVPENIPLDVLYEDDGMVVINKPPGMVVHPARGNWTGTLTSALAYRFQSLSDVGGPTRPGIVHRLDRDTSGVIVVAKTNAVHVHLSAQFADRSTEKEYYAITNAPLDRDRDIIDAPIGRHPYQRDKMAIRDGHVTSKPASTFYEVISRHGRFVQVRLLPKTGRTHQLRVHLAHIRSPILCDKLYGGHSEVSESSLKLGKRDESDKTVVLNRQALHARKLTIVNPQTGKPMTFEAPIPDDLQRVIDMLP